jgi:heme oxygenase
MTQSATAARLGLARAQKISEGGPDSKPRSAIGAVHRELRTATRIEHAMIDQMLLPFDLNRANHYQNFLKVHLTALDLLRPDWRSQDDDDFAQMLQCVKSDLQTLGNTNSISPFGSQAFSDAAKGLGIAYVIRGSRLGAAVLSRGIVSGLPTSYLDFVPTQSWAAFLLELELIVDDAAARGEATCGARSAFDIFAKGFRRMQFDPHDG